MVGAGFPSPLPHRAGEPRPYVQNREAYAYCGIPFPPSCRSRAGGYNAFLVKGAPSRSDEWWRGSMPHTRSAKKHDRKTEKRRLHNRSVKKVVKTEIKQFHAALEGPIED